MDPDAKEFEAWQDSLNLESQQDDIAALMANNEKLRQNFETLVPSKVCCLIIIIVENHLKKINFMFLLIRFPKLCFGRGICFVYMLLERKKLKDRSYVKMPKSEPKLTLRETI